LVPAIDGSWFGWRIGRPSAPMPLAQVRCVTNGVDSSRSPVARSKT